MIRFTLIPLLALTLASCGSDRFSRQPPGGMALPPAAEAPSSPPPTIYQRNPDADLETPPAQFRPIPPVSGGIMQTPLTQNPIVQSPLIGNELPPPPVVGGAIPAPKTVVASLPKPPSIPVAPAAPRGNTGPVGTWSVSDTDGNCRITLTSLSLADYNRATSNCKGASLSKVNGWEKRGSDVILYEPGGKIAARLSQQGDSSFAGSTSKGADVKMSR